MDVYSTAAPTQEAAWQCHRELVWQSFLRNAARIIDAPIAQRDALLAIYHAEAIRHYGEQSGGRCGKEHAELGVIEAGALTWLRAFATFDAA